MYGATSYMACMSSPGEHMTRRLEEAEEIKEIGREKKVTSNTERQEEGAAVWNLQATGPRAGTERWWWERDAGWLLELLSREKRSRGRPTVSVMRKVVETAPAPKSYRKVTHGDYEC